MVNHHSYISNGTLTNYSFVVFLVITVEINDANNCLEILN